MLSNFSDFIEIFILMLGSFLIGYLFAYFYFKSRLDTFSSSLSVKHINDVLDTTVEGGIKAKKTFERGGLGVTEALQPEIDFNVENNPTEEAHQTNDEIKPPVKKTTPKKKP